MANGTQAGRKISGFQILQERQTQIHKNIDVIIFTSHTFYFLYIIWRRYMHTSIKLMINVESQLYNTSEYIYNITFENLITYRFPVIILYIL